MYTDYPLPGGGTMRLEQFHFGGLKYAAEEVTAQQWRACIGMQRAPVHHGALLLPGSALAEHLQTLSAQVSARVLDVITRRAGGDTLKEVGLKLKISSQRVSQMEARGVHSMLACSAAEELCGKIDELLDQSGGSLLIENSGTSLGLHLLTCILGQAYATGKLKFAVHWRWSGHTEQAGTKNGPGHKLSLEADERTSEAQPPAYLVLSRVSAQEATALSRALDMLQVWLTEDGKISTQVLPELLESILHWQPGQQTIQNKKHRARQERFSEDQMQSLSNSAQLLTGLRDRAVSLGCTPSGYLIAGTLIAPDRLVRHRDGSVSSGGRNTNNVGRKTAAMNEAMTRLDKAGIKHAHPSVLGVIAQWSQRTGLADINSFARMQLLHARQSIHLENAPFSGHLRLRAATEQIGRRRAQAAAIMLAELRRRGVSTRYDELKAEAIRHGYHLGIGDQHKRWIVQQMQAMAQQQGETLVECTRVLTLSGTARDPEERERLTQRLREAEQALMTRPGADKGEVKGKHLWPEFPRPPAAPPGWIDSELSPYVIGLVGQGWSLTYGNGEWYMSRSELVASRRIRRAYYSKSQPNQADFELGLLQLARDISPQALKRVIDWAEQHQSIHEGLKTKALAESKRQNTPQQHTRQQHTPQHKRNSR